MSNDVVCVVAATVRSYVIKEVAQPLRQRHGRLEGVAAAFKRTCFFVPDIN